MIEIHQFLAIPLLESTDKIVQWAERTSNNVVTSLSNIPNKLNGSRLYTNNRVSRTKLSK